jgi:tetratricopeptide (TPR) repeat protein
VTVGHVLNNLGNTYESMGQPILAREHYLRALAVYEASDVLTGVQMARLLRNLARVSAALGDLEGAESWYRRSLETWEQALGKNNPTYVGTLFDLAGVVDSAGRTEEAERLRARADTLGTS